MTARRPPGPGWGSRSERVSLQSVARRQVRSARIWSDLIRSGQGTSSQRVTVGSITGGQVAKPFPDLAEVVWLEAGGGEPVELGDVEAADDSVQGGDAVAGGSRGPQRGRHRH